MRRNFIAQVISAQNRIHNCVGFIFSGISKSLPLLNRRPSIYPSVQNRLIPRRYQSHYEEGIRLFWRSNCKTKAIQLRPTSKPGNKKQLVYLCYFAIPTVYAGISILRMLGNISSKKPQIRFSWGKSRLYFFPSTVFCGKDLGIENCTKTDRLDMYWRFYDRQTFVTSQLPVR